MNIWHNFSIYAWSIFLAACYCNFKSVLFVHIHDDILYVQ